MINYTQIIKQAEQLPFEEQKKLLQELTQLIQQKEKINPNFDNWFGFLSKKVDPLEFQQQLREEWDE